MSLRWIAALWPLLWVLGIDQFVVPALALALVVVNAPRIFRSPMPAPAKWALACLLFMLLPAWRIEAEYRLIFFRYVLTYSSQFAFLLLCSAIEWERDKEELLGALRWLAWWIALGGILFVTGIWTDRAPTLLSFFLPTSLTEGSSFFESIGTRGFGVSGYEGELLDSRLTSFALKYSDLSFLTLLLLPIALWSTVSLRGWHKVPSALAVAGLFLCLLYAQSRMAWAALLLGSLSAVWLTIALRTARTGLARVLFAALSAVAISAVSVVVWKPAQRIVLEKVIATRPGSALVRFKVYQATLADLPRHVLIGWGTSRRVPGLPNRFSAGTHSGPLGTLYQRGTIGLFLYLGLLASIWRPLLRKLRNRGSSPTLPFAFASSLLCFHFRELADLWAWDQLLAYATWTFWIAVVSFSAPSRLPAARLDS